MKAGRVGWPRLGEVVSLSVTMRRALSALAAEEYNGLAWNPDVPEEAGVYNHVDPDLLPARVVGSYELGSGTGPLINETAIYDCTEGATNIFVEHGTLIPFSQTVPGQIYLKEFTKLQPLELGRSYAYGRGHGSPSGTSYALWIRQGVNYGSYNGPRTNGSGDFCRSRFDPAPTLIEGPEYGFYDLREVRSADAVEVLASGRLFSAPIASVTTAPALKGSTDDTKRGFFAMVSVGFPAAGAGDFASIALNGQAPTAMFGPIQNTQPPTRKPAVWGFFWDYTAMSVMSGTASLVVTLNGAPASGGILVDWMECTNVSATGHEFLGGIQSTATGTVTVDSVTYDEMRITLPSVPEGDVVLATSISNGVDTTDITSRQRSLVSERAGDFSWVTAPKTNTSAHVDRLGAVGTTNVMFCCHAPDATQAGAVAAAIFVPKRWGDNTVVVPVSTSNKIQYLTGTTGTPPAGRARGEIAFNVTTKQMWVYDSAGNPVEIV